MWKRVEATIVIVRKDKTTHGASDGSVSEGRYAPEERLVALGCTMLPIALSHPERDFLVAICCVLVLLVLLVDDTPPVRAGRAGSDVAAHVHAGVVMQWR